MNLPRRTPAAAAFPVPDGAALEHSRRLTAHIHDAIDSAGGSIGFERYMQLALYAPGLGYYSAGATKFGSAGDFSTAPEFAPLFAACIARQCGELLARSRGVILELGAGSGALAAALLERLDPAPDAYLILETSADLRQRQQQRLAAYGERVRWLDTLPAAPIRGVIFANEVLDALPVQRVCVRGAALEELVVSRRDAGFAWDTRPAEAPLADCARTRLAGLPPLPDGYRTEINTGLHAWLAALSAILERGALLCIDYGYTRREYYHPDRGDGTLICHYRHRAHADPFLYPGLQDISCSVDFTALAEAAVAAGLEVGGFTPQAQFLLGCGLLQLAAAEASPDRDAAAQIRRLTLPGEMGEHFKAMILLRGVGGPLPAFALADQRRRL